jgi:hypothetical protein
MWLEIEEVASFVFEALKKGAGPAALFCSLPGAPAIALPAWTIIFHTLVPAIQDENGRNS